MVKFKDWYGGSTKLQKVICYVAFMGNAKANIVFQEHDTNYITHQISRGECDYKLCIGLKQSGFNLLANIVYKLVKRYGQSYFDKAYIPSDSVTIKTQDTQSY